MKLVPRSLKAPTFTAGEMEPYELPIKNVVHHWQLILAFAFSVAGGTGVGTFFADMHGRVLRKWVLRGNGKPLIIMTGQTLAIYALLFLREVYEQTPPDALAAGTNQADRELRLLLPAVMSAATADQESEFGFPPVSDPSMEFHWGDAEDLAQDTDGALSIDGATARLIEYRYDDPTTPPAGYAPLMAYTREQSVNGDEDLLFQLHELSLGFELRAIIIEGLTDGQAGGRDYEYSNDVVETVKLLEVNGVERHRDVRFADIQQQNKIDYGLGALSDLTGIGVIDAAADGNVRRGELWAHNVRSTPQLLLGCSAQGANANKVRITTIFTAR